MLNFHSEISKIGGWLTETEAMFLYECAKKLSKDSLIIEIGSWKGRSTICLGKGVKDGYSAKIYAIDPHTGSSEQRKWYGKVNTYDEFLKNIKAAGVDNHIVPLRKTSEEAAKEFKRLVDFVFIDGAHEYEFVKKEDDSWFPKLRNGGVVAFHDCWHAPGVHFLTVIILLTSSRVRRPKLIDTLTVMEKVEKNTTWERMGNFVFIIYRLLFGWIGTLKMDYFGTLK